MPSTLRIHTAVLVALLGAPACLLTDVSGPTSDLLVLDSKHLLGVEVDGSMQQGIGEVDDLLIDASSGVVVGALVRSAGGGTGGLGLVELSSLKRDPSRPVLVVEGTGEELLRMPSYRDLFEAKTPGPLEGEIRGIERVGGGRSEVRLVDAENLFHRVLIEAAALVARRAPRLAVGERLRFLAIETRDERGKVWIASQIDLKEGPLVLRDSSGRVLWPSLGCLTSRELVGAPLHTADGRAGKVNDWKLDWTTATLAGIEFELDGREYELTWADLVRATDGTWRTSLLASELRPIETIQETEASIPVEAPAPAPLPQPDP